jgi:hypothetical protein
MGNKAMTLRTLVRICCYNCLHTIKMHKGAFARLETSPCTFSKIYSLRLFCILYFLTF